MAGNLVISQINGGPIGVVNAIINGNYQINQRGVSGTVTLTAGNYGHDRWKAGSGGCVYTFATANNVTTLTITAGTLVQVIEGLNLISGTYALSFTGTAQGKIGAGSFAASGVTGAAVGGTNLNIEFNTGTVSLVQFEPGSEVSPFERRPITTELGLCQRYFQKSYNQSVVPGTASTTVGQIIILSNNSSFGEFLQMRFPVTMRASPTMVTFNPNSGASGSIRNITASSNVTASINSAGESGLSNVDSALTSGSVFALQYTASAEL